MTLTHLWSHPVADSTMLKCVTRSTRGTYEPEQVPLFLRYYRLTPGGRAGVKYRHDTTTIDDHAVIRTTTMCSSRTPV
jgi:hypothetical protein